MGKGDHKSRKHALLSASGASRWMNCTPSPRLEESFRETTSEFAEEGTLAHEIAEATLRQELGLINARSFSAKIRELRKSKFYTPEMDDEVRKHVDYVQEQFLAAKTQTKGAIILVEERVDLTEFIEDGFGTCDTNIIADGVLEVIDLKYGKGVRVKAENNAQLMLYGLGALMKYDLMYDIDTVKLTITQPRMDSISSWEIPKDELLRWGEEEVKSKAELAYEGAGEQITGSWCQFCKAKPRCKALEADALEMAKHDFADHSLLTDQEMVEIYGKASIIIDWLNGVSKYMLVEAINGKVWEGLKLVEGRSTRRWTDEEEVIEILKKLDYKEKDYVNKKLAGIGQIEKLLGKADFPILMDRVIIKPKGAANLVEASDKRPPYIVATAADDFGEETEDL